MEIQKLKWNTDEVPTRDGENSIKIGGLNLHNIVVAGEEKLEQAIDDQSTENCEPHDRPVDEVVRGDPRTFLVCVCQKVLFVPKERIEYLFFCLKFLGRLNKKRENLILIYLFIYYRSFS